MEYETRTAESVLDKYEILTPFDTDANVFLVKDRKTQELCVQKTVSVHNLALYQQMKDYPLIGVPKIYGIYTENGKTILIEEYIHGLNLMQMTINNGPFSETEVVSYFSRLCYILDQLHRMDPPVIHKDIKPGNLILTNENELYLIDFNISREYNPHSTLDTIAMVSPHFSSPESYGFGQTDARSDIYSMGATMHYLLTGGYLKETDYQGTLKEIILKCTMMDPENRYQSVHELKEALDSRYPDKVNKTSDDHHPMREDNRAINSKYADVKKESFLPPGFRSKKPLRIIIALIVYALIAVLCFTMDIESTLREPFKIVDLWLERVSVFIFFILTIFILFDYRGCLDRIPGINRLKSGILRRLVSIFILFSVILSTLVLFIVIMSLF